MKYLLHDEFYARFTTKSLNDVVKKLMKHFEYIIPFYRNFEASLMRTLQLERKKVKETIQKIPMNHLHMPFGELRS